MKKKKPTLNKDFLDQESKRKDYDTEADYQHVDSDDTLEAIYVPSKGPVIKTPEEIRKHRNPVPVKKLLTPEDGLKAISRPKENLEQKDEVIGKLAQIHYDDSFSGKISSLISYVTGSKYTSDDIKYRIEEVTEAISEAISAVINSNNKVQNSEANLDASAHAVFDNVYNNPESMEGRNADREVMARANVGNVRVEKSEPASIIHNLTSTALKITPALSKNPLQRTKKADPTSVANSFSRPPSPSESLEAAKQAGDALRNFGVVKSDRQTGTQEVRSSSVKKETNELM